MSADAAATSAAQRIGRWLLRHEGRLFGALLAVLAADSWRGWWTQLDDARDYLAAGIWGTPVLSLAVMGLSAVYMSVIALILWTARPPVAQYPTLAPNLLAVAGGFGIYAFGLLSPADEPPLGIVAPLALLLAGVFLVLWSLWHLKRSFSVVPQARSLVRRGPYRFVRHPMYLGNCLTLAGLGLLNGTAPGLSLAALLCVLQIVRARYEERLLCSVFAEYSSAMNELPAFLPFRGSRRGRDLGLLLAAACAGLVTAAVHDSVQAQGSAQGATSARYAATCQAWHRKALAGQWFTQKEASAYARTESQQDAMDAVPACHAFFALQESCQQLVFGVINEYEGPSAPPTPAYLQASNALLDAVENKPGCKSVAGVEEVCRLLRERVRRGKTLSPKLGQVMRECADKSLLTRTAGLIRGAM